MKENDDEFKSPTRMHEYDQSHLSSPQSQETVGSDASDTEEIHVEHPPLPPPHGQYTCEEFVSKLWHLAEQDFGYYTSDVEYGRLVRKGNNHVDFLSSSLLSQSKATYGRIKPYALEKVFQLMDLNSTDIFIDLGHGIGNATLQAAYTRGCDSRGIEIMQDRCFIANQFKEKLAEIKHLLHEERDGDNRSVGQVTLVEGDFTLKCHRNFITGDRKRVVKAFVNNAEGVFGCRSDRTKCPQLDEYCGALFANMCPDSVMITIEPLFCLGRSLTEENQYRRDLLKYERHPDASFFEHQRFSIGECAVTWGDAETFVHVYKRVAQSSENGESRFICSHVKCDASRSCIATDALQADSDTDEKIGILNDHCIVCYKKRMPPQRRLIGRRRLSCRELDEVSESSTTKKVKRMNSLR